MRPRHTCAEYTARSLFVLAFVLGHVSAVEGQALLAKVRGTEDLADNSTYFGASVAIDGDTMVAGAPESLPAGAAYVYARSGFAWVLQARLVPFDGTGDDRFGDSVGISGNTIVVGANRGSGPNGRSGSAYVFSRSGDIWAQDTKLIASDSSASDQFGWSVAIGDNALVVGAPSHDGPVAADQGSAYTFVRSGSTWIQQSRLTASDAATSDLHAAFGFSVAISKDKVLVGAPYHGMQSAADAGSAYVFFQNGGIWTEQAELVAADAMAQDNFGWSVAISGETALVGAPSHDGPHGVRQGAAYVYLQTENGWGEHTLLVGSESVDYDYFGMSVALADARALVGVPFSSTEQSGAAYVFLRTGLNWTQQFRQTAVDGSGTIEFGCSVAISHDKAVIGSERGGWSVGKQVFIGSASIVDVALSGACCVNGKCSIIGMDQCADLGGSFQGVNTSCSGLFCSATFICCHADMNNDQVVDGSDIQAFADALLSGKACP